MVRVYYEVLNQKGSPALYSDNYANRPAAGYVGRVFFSPDTGQIFYDTGSTWTLLADAGVGGGSLASVCANGNTTATGISITAGGLSSNSITNTGNTAGSILFAGTGGLESQSNATFFWDNTNKRLGIGNNTPGAPLDVHGTGTQIQLNGTGTNNSYLQFQNAGTSKWRIGNTYSAGSNFFHLYNNTTATTILAIDGSNNFFFNSTAQYTFAGPILANNSLGFKEGVGISTTSGYTTFNAFKSGSTNTLGIVFGTGIEADLNFNNVATYSYTFPTSSGTIALTSNITSAINGTTSYMPKFTGTNAIGNSIMYDTGSAIVINGTAGTSVFNVYAGANNNAMIVTGSQPTILLQANGASNTTSFNFSPTSGYDAIIANTNAGALNFQTNSLNRVYVNVSGYVGINTISPSTYLDVNGATRVRSTLQVDSYTTTTTLNITSSTQAALNFSSGAGYSNSLTFAVNSVNVAAFTLDATYTQLRSYGSYGFLFQTYDGTNALAIRYDSSIIQLGYALSGSTFAFSGSANVIGSFGVGTNTPSTKLHVLSTAATTAALFEYNGGTNAYVGIKSTTTTNYIGNVAGAMTFEANGSERMRITAAGKIQVGATLAIGGTMQVFNDATAGINIMNSSNSGNLMIFLNNSAVSIGSITTNNSTTSYNTTSDYRLKEDYKEFDGLALISQMKMYDFAYKSDKSRMYGVIAHELQEVIPYMVNGEKDGELMQGVDYSKLTPILVKGIQQIDARLSILEQKIA